MTGLYYSAIFQDCESYCIFWKIMRVIIKGEEAVLMELSTNKRKTYNLVITDQIPNCNVCEWSAVKKPIKQGNERDRLRKTYFEGDDVSFQNCA